MKDPAYIQQMISRAKEAGVRVKTEFGELTLEQLNWKPAPDSWSIGQCLDHLVLAGTSYFPQFEAIAEGKFNMTFWQRWSPFSGMFGRLLVNQVQEKVKRKVPAPGIIKPSTSNIDKGILDRFQKQLDSLTDYYATFIPLDIDKTRIYSPVSHFITYNLRHTITLLTNHLHRHINQGIRVKNNKDFPALVTTA